MKPKQRILALFIVIMILLISGCGPGQLFGPTVTPIPTITPTPSVGAIKGRIIYERPDELSICVCLVLDAGENRKVMVIGNLDTSTRPDRDGYFEIKNIEPGSINLCTQQSQSFLDQDPTSYPFMDAKGNVMSIEVLAGQTVDLGEIPVLERRK
jgi:hypothetical protein